MMNGQEISDTRLFVKNIPPEWDEWNVFQVFKKYGVVNLVQLPASKPGYQFRFGFVEMLHESGAKAALGATTGKHQSLIVDNSSHPLHVEACLLHNPRKADSTRPLGQQNQNRLHPNDDQHQHSRRSPGSRGDGFGSRSPTSNGDTPSHVRDGQPPQRRSPAGSDQKRIVEHNWHSNNKSNKGTRLPKFDHGTIFFDPSVHRHVDIQFNAPTQVTIPISAIKNPSDFYAIVDSAAAERRELQEKMAEYYKDKKVGLDGVEEDELVVLAIGGGSDDGISYNRMLVVKTDSGEKVQGLMVDDTGIVFASIDQLLPITAEFAAVPFQAIPCGLYGVDCGAGGWSEAAKQLFLSLLVCNDGDTLITQTSFSGLKALVRVTISEQGQTVDCAKRLSQMAYCIYDSKERKVYTRNDIVNLKSTDKGFASKPTLGSEVAEIMVKN